MTKKIYTTKKKAWAVVDSDGELRDPSLNVRDTREEARQMAGERNIFYNSGYKCKVVRCEIWY